MIARSPQPGGGRGERAPQEHPRAAPLRARPPRRRPGLAPHLPAEGAGGPTAGPGRGPAGLMLPGGGRAGKAPVNSPSARDLAGRRRALLPPKPPPAVPPSHPLRGRGERSGSSAPSCLGCPTTALLLPLPFPRRCQPKGPRNGASPGGSGAPGPPCPSPGAAAANSRDSVFGGGNKHHPTHSPTVMFVTACPSLGVERSMTGLCCLNKNQWQLKGENSSY